MRHYMFKLVLGRVLFFHWSILFLCEIWLQLVMEFRGVESLLERESVKFRKQVDWK